LLRVSLFLPSRINPAISRVVVYSSKVDGSLRTNWRFHQLKQQQLSLAA
jgi:hypothetical protein